MAKIMVVDDSSIMRRNLKAILTQGGHEIVAEAENGKQAVAEYGKILPDLVTMDITMPFMDGIEAVRQIISKFPDAKIIMVSALDQKKMVFEALQNGAKHYIIKPITVQKVLDIVDEVLKNTELEDNNSTEIKSDTSAIEEKNEEESKIELKKDYEPFKIENKNGSFVITITDKIDDESFNSLKMAISGLLFVKPLKVYFDFKYIEKLSDVLLDNFNNMINSILENGGEYHTSSENLKFIEYTREKGLNLF